MNLFPHFSGIPPAFPPGFIYYIIALMAGAGIWLLYLERTLIIKGFLSYRWPKVKAVIQDQRDDSFYLTGFSYSTMSNATIRFKEIAYIYEYKIGNHIYHSSNYCFGGYSDRCDATFVIGQHIRVSYNPENPKEAVIKCGLMPGALIGLLLIFLAVAGTVMNLYMNSL